MCNITSIIVASAVRPKIQPGVKGKFYGTQQQFHIVKVKLCEMTLGICKSVDLYPKLVNLKKEWGMNVWTNKSDRAPTIVRVLPSYVYSWGSCLVTSTAASIT